MRLELPLPGLYNVYNALAAIAAGAGARTRPRTRIARRAGGDAGRLRPGRDDRGRRARRLSILLIKNPAGANEVLRTLRLEAGERGARPLDRAQRPDRRRPRRLLDLGRRLRAAGRRRCARVVCAGTRAPEMALRLKYAGWPTEAIEVEPAIEGSLDRAARGRPGPALRPPHLHRPARAAQAARRPRPGRGVLAMTAEAIWHDVECGAYTADLPLWEELADRRRRARHGPRLRCRPGRPAPGPARARAVIGVDRDPELVAAVWERAPEGCRPTPRSRTRAPSSSPDRVRAWCSAPMQLIQLLADSESGSPASIHAAAACCPEAAPPSRSSRSRRPRCPRAAPPPLPDVREVDGWVYSSLPLEPVGRRRARSCCGGCARPSSPTAS